MKIQTFSIVAGTEACNAHCPFCVSKMTGHTGAAPTTGDINFRNLRKAVQLAKLGGCTTVLITGKGEPTLCPDEIQTYLIEVGREFPFIELQTNGLSIGRAAVDPAVKMDDRLRNW